MKFKIGVILMVFLLFGVRGVFAAGEDCVFLRGDVDRGGGVNIGDAVSILNYLFAGGVAPGCLDSADVDDDGSVNLADAINILNYLFAGGDAPAYPHPNPGIDSVSDGLTCYSGVSDLLCSAEVIDTCGGFGSYVSNGESCVCSGRGVVGPGECCWGEIRESCDGSFDVWSEMISDAKSGSSSFVLRGCVEGKCNPEDHEFEFIGGAGYHYINPVVFGDNLFFERIGLNDQGIYVCSLGGSLSPEKCKESVRRVSKAGVKSGNLAVGDYGVNLLVWESEDFDGSGHVIEGCVIDEESDSSCFEPGVEMVLVNLEMDYDAYPVVRGRKGDAYMFWNEVDVNDNDLLKGCSLSVGVDYADCVGGIDNYGNFVLVDGVADYLSGSVIRPVRGVDGADIRITRDVNGEDISVNVMNLLSDGGVDERVTSVRQIPRLFELSGGDCSASSGGACQYLIWKDVISGGSRMFSMRIGPSDREVSFVDLFGLKMRDNNFLSSHEFKFNPVSMMYGDKIIAKVKKSEWHDKYDNNFINNKISCRLNQLYCIGESCVDEIVDDCGIERL